MSVTVILDLAVKPESVGEVKNTLKEILPDTRAYDGCHGVSVVDNQYDPGNIMLIETWSSRPHYEKYLSWRQETGLLDALGKLVTAPPSIRYMDPVDA